MGSTSSIPSSKKHTEEVLETAIVETLIHQGGYRLTPNDQFQRTSALNPAQVIEFLQRTQKTEWDKISAIHKENAETNLLNRLLKELDLHGSLHVLRKGFTDYGVTFRMAYFKPETSLNETARAQYEANILSVMRQVRYSQKNDNALDLVLFLNGIPIATAELKKPVYWSDC